MTRHAGVAAIALALFGTACASAPPTITPAPAAPEVSADMSTAEPTRDPNALALQVAMKNTHLTVGMERLAFEITDPQGGPVPSSATVDVGIYRVEEIAEGQTMSNRTASGSAVRFGDELPGGGAWVVYHDFDASGPWSVEANVAFGDGRTGSGKARVEVDVPGAMPRTGTVPSAVDTPKLAPGTDIATITSDPEPLEALYQMTLGDAMASGRPTVVVFCSPGHAAGEASKTTLEQVKAEQAAMGSQVNFIHVESVDLADPAKPSAAATAWGLPGEPWTFLLDAQGSVASRIEGQIGRTELDLWVKRLLGQ